MIDDQTKTGAFDFFKNQPVADRNSVEECKEFVETVAPFAQNFEEKIDFSRGLNGEGAHKVICRGGVTPPLRSQ